MFFFILIRRAFKMCLQIIWQVTSCLNEGVKNVGKSYVSKTLGVEISQLVGDYPLRRFFL